MKRNTKQLIPMILVFTIIAAAYSCRILAMLDIGGAWVNYIRAALYLLLFSLWGYSIDRRIIQKQALHCLRLTAALDGSVMSITSLYWYGFVWENEIHDLFGLDVRFIAPDVDYGGHFYHLAQKTPWHDLSNAVHAKQAVKVNLRSGLGVDASVVKKEDGNG